MKVILAAVALAATTTAVSAQERWIGEITLVGFNFCPRGTVPAQGQLLPIAQNQALFALYGTLYGGDGRTNFALPDLRGRVPVGSGQGQGLSNIQQGARGGAETHTQTVQELANHTHATTVTINGTTAQGSSPTPVGNLPSVSAAAAIYAPPGGSTARWPRQWLRSRTGPQVAARRCRSGIRISACFIV